MMLRYENIYDENKQMIVNISNKVKSSGVFNRNVKVIMELNSGNAKRRLIKSSHANPERGILYKRPCRDYSQTGSRLQVKSKQFLPYLGKAGGKEIVRHSKKLERVVTTLITKSEDRLVANASKDENKCNIFLKGIDG